MNVFQDLCSIRLHEINRRGSDIKDFAMSFAQAAYELLMKSSKDGSSRLRQYYSIYVRITTGDTEKQSQKIRELLDAGIFVYSGGANTPRTLGNDSNPINQFKLTYRKLYGISNLIGLTQGDRFELSGKDLEAWLNNPENGKEILMKNVGGVSSNVDADDDLEDTIMRDDEKLNIKEIIQSELFFKDDTKSEAIYYEKEEIKKLIKDKTPLCKEIKFSDLKKEKFDILITGLGFEERTLESLKNLLTLKPQKILLIRYEEKGKTTEIINIIEKHHINYEIIDFENVKTSFDAHLGNVLCDITGLSKSLIFNIVRNVLKINNRICLSHVQAEKYYPLNEEIEMELSKTVAEDDFSKLNIITKKVWKGEEGPYEIYDLLFSDTDESKRNIIIGFSNAKYERLFKILENRQFDRIGLVTPDVLSKRDYLANLASEVILKQFPNTDLYLYGSNELDKMLNFLTSQYQKFYIDQNYNFEIALTGSKRHTVASAIISASFKIAHCWYVKPKRWDVEKFSKGVGEKTYFSIEL